LKNLIELYKGFLWGIGFALATGLIYIVLISKLAASVEYGYKNQLQEVSSREFNSFSDSLDIEIVKTSIESGKVVFATKHMNLHNAYFIYSTYKISLSLFDKSGEFISKCESGFPNEHSTEKDIYTVVECPIIFGQPNDFDHAKVAIKQEIRT
jgi:hypothetical protein